MGIFGLGLAAFVPLGNPAYRICLMSVLTGALVVGVMTLLMTRIIMMLLRSVAWADRLKTDEALDCPDYRETSALLFGFNRGVWLWACVPEMRVLNVFMFILTACTFFAWTMRPNGMDFCTRRFCCTVWASQPSDDRGDGGAVHGWGVCGGIFAGAGSRAVQGMPVSGRLLS